jgi:hypothetical protein
MSEKYQPKTGPGDRGDALSFRAGTTGGREELPKPAVMDCACFVSASFASLRLRACLKMGKSLAAVAAFAWFVYFAVYYYLSLLVSAFRLSISAFCFLFVYFAVNLLFIFIFGHRRSRLVTSGHLWQESRLMFSAFCAFLRP